MVPSKLLCIKMFHVQGNVIDVIIIELDFMKFEIVAKLNVRILTLNVRCRERVVGADLADEGICCQYIPTQFLTSMFLF